MIHVLMIDDVRAVCDMTVATLRAEPDLEVRGYPAAPEQLKGQLVWCDVVVINASAENAAFLQLIETIHRLSSRIKIIVIGLVGTHSFLLRCLEAGINGYLLQDSSLSDLLRTLRAVNSDQTLVPAPQRETGTALRLGDLPQVESVLSANRLNLLTRREREVLGLVQHGLTNKEIADILVVELGTVKNHVHSILHKLNINSRRETLYLPQSAGPWHWAQRPEALSAEGERDPNYSIASRLAAFNETTSSR